MTNAYYKDKYGREFSPGKGLPTVSTDLDSVRTYQFEVQFTGLPSDVSNEGDLTLAAKKVVGDTSLASGLGLKADINALGGKLGNQLAATAGQLAGNFPGVSGLLNNFKSELKPSKCNRDRIRFDYLDSKAD